MTELRTEIFKPAFELRAGRVLKREFELRTEGLKCEVELVTEFLKCEFEPMTEE